MSRSNTHLHQSLRENARLWSHLSIKLSSRRLSSMRTPHFCEVPLRPKGVRASMLQRWRERGPLREDVYVNEKLRSTSLRSTVLFRRSSMHENLRTILEMRQSQLHSSLSSRTLSALSRSFL